MELKLDAALILSFWRYSSRKAGDNKLAACIRSEVHNLVTLLQMSVPGVSVDGLEIFLLEMDAFGLGSFVLG